MGVLQTAGIVSGFGQGLGQGLQTLQQGIINEGILNAREDRADARASADRVFQEMKLREQQSFEERLKDKEIGAADVRSTKEIVARKEEANAGRTSQEGIHKADRLSIEAVSKASNASAERIAALKATVDREQLKSTELVSLGNSITALQTNIEHQYALLADPLKNNPEDPNIKSLQLELDAQRKTLADARAKYFARVDALQTRDKVMVPSSAPPPERKPYVHPGAQIPSSSGALQTPNYGNILRSRP